MKSVIFFLNEFYSLAAILFFVISWSSSSCRPMKVADIVNKLKKADYVKVLICVKEKLKMLSPTLAGYLFFSFISKTDKSYSLYRQNLKLYFVSSIHWKNYKMQYRGVKGIRLMDGVKVLWVESGCLKMRSHSRKGGQTYQFTHPGT